jgi:hypothetical protein
MFLGAVHIRQMTDEVAVQLVNVDTPEIVKLLALKAKHPVTCDDGDMYAVAIPYVAIHDQPPMQLHRLRLLAGDRETSRALFHLRLQPLLWWPQIGALQSRYLHAKSPDLPKRVVMVLPRWKLARGR